jgi:uncharacterized protein (TIGR03435 family)
MATAAIVAIGAVHALRAQTPATDTKPPAFEVASIKPNKSGEVATSGMRAEGTQFRATNITVRSVLMQSYQLLQESELIGGPSLWIDTDRFDIVAKVERPGPVFPMVRTLLA